MTDNNSNSDQNSPLENKKAAAPADQTKRTLPQNVTPNKINAEQATTGSSTPATKTPEPQMKKVDIAIAGITYAIFCPINEEEELRSAVYYINNFVLDIKREAPNLGQENLLVLCCLNLYEKINAHKKTNEDQRHESKEADALLSKIMKDAQSVL
ncbi:cell division protein ZapA [Psychrobacter sp. LV10R520-6]|uniref:cell division protein ZapA n=1 Tax=Psychrobacter sp. LV10R520-6 TaxID=1415574 RepID=UPI0024C5C87C|nr:cell division protein ZapA [Psychrobacter sp. LV10R520-6]SNT70588.1 cell division protein ZapA [Psychrobacter sp. LV10R520-6]